MGSYYNHEKLMWEERKRPQIPINSKCLCWLSECKCQFQRHTDYCVFCDDPEIFRLCLDNEDINYGEVE